MDEREKALNGFNRKYCELSNSQLHLRLENVTLGKVSGLDDFVAKATKT
jgi:hypothetical protein